VTGFTRGFAGITAAVHDMQSGLPEQPQVGIDGAGLSRLSPIGMPPDEVGGTHCD
jgi:hypothetical protein